MILKLSNIVEMIGSIKSFSETFGVLIRIIGFEIVFTVDGDSEILDLLYFGDELILIFFCEVYLVKNNFDD